MKEMKPAAFVLRTASVTLLLVSIMGLFSGFPPMARASPMVLYAAPTAQGSGDCSSWANACTLQNALAQAVSGDEIWVKAGVHYPGSNRDDTYSLKPGVALYGGFAGYETSRDQRNWETNRTILSGDIDQNDENTDNNFIAETWEDIQGSNAYHVMRNNTIDSSAVLDGFVITAGQANGATFPYQRGGGIYNEENASPNLSHLLIIGNYAQYGGGMYNFYGSNPALSQVDFVGNAAGSPGGGGNPSGGGMYNNQSHPTLEEVTFRGNQAGDFGGGMVNSLSNPTLNKVRFEQNSAHNSGGGLANLGVDELSQSEPKLTNVTFFENHALHQHGGGMYSIYSSPELRNVHFQGNTANENGGGIYNQASNTLKVLGSTLSGNIAEEEGGGLYDSESHLTITDTTFEANKALRGGGLSAQYDIVNLSAVDFTANEANIKGAAPAHGGGLFAVNCFALTLSQVTFEGNSADIDGGGAYIENCPGLGMYQVAFTANQADQSGGGLYLFGADLATGLTFVTFEDNQAQWGGGMVNMLGAPMINQAVFRKNVSAYLGGGLYNIFYANPRLWKVLFEKNQVESGTGGGMANLDHSNPLLNMVLFRQNQASTGGGFYNCPTCEPMVFNALFHGNLADWGGGVLNNGSLTLVNATFHGNSATNQGGGLYNDNTAPSACQLTNVILWGDSAPAGAEIFHQGGLLSVSYSDVQGCGASGGGWNPACGSDGGGNIDADPRFVAPTSGNLRLERTSPAIDAGNNSVLPSYITTDLDLKGRFFNIVSVPDRGLGTPPIVDMGAYETWIWEFFLTLIRRW